MPATQTKTLDLPNTERERKQNFYARLCERYLPFKTDDAVWLLSRESRREEPLQGWKLHISATILEAVDLFEKIAPFLAAEDVQFKAPCSLDELSRINCGLYYGYHQVGKFITVYPSTEKQAIELAARLDELTKEFFALSVPFDKQYAPGSSVFYRYGAFSNIEITDENGKHLALRNADGQLVPDNRLQAVPEWVSNPFPQNKETKTSADTPLKTTYKVFRAITQRGKGGTYQAFDLSGNAPRLCIVKEGRKNGERGWNGQDGYFLVKNEFEVLTVLREKCASVPQIFSSFEIDGNFYFAMEFVAGKSLDQLLQPRERRFSFRQVIEFSISIAKTIEAIHQAGWIWNDCKPANLIITADKSFRPIDFEGAYPADQAAKFDWQTQGFSNSAAKAGGKTVDIYALGAVVYFLLTARFYEADAPVKLKKLRRNVPQQLIELTEKLLSAEISDISEARLAFENLLSKCISK